MIAIFDKPYAGSSARMMGQHELLSKQFMRTLSFLPHALLAYSQIYQPERKLRNSPPFSLPRVKTTYTMSPLAEAVLVPHRVRTSI